MKNNKLSFIMYLILLAMLTLGSACASQQKHKKHKAVPCPCETRHKVKH